MNHIIQRQYLEVELNGTENDGLVLQSRLSDLCQHWLLPALERAMDRTGLQAEHLYIDRLELDAGVFRLDELEHDFVEAVAQALEKTVREQLAVPETVAKRQVNVGNWQRKSDDRMVWDVLLHFLETGRLPWYFQMPANTSLEQHLWHNLQKKSLQPATIAAIVRLLATTSAGQKRMAWQFSTEFKKAFLQHIAPELMQTLHAVLETMPRMAIADSEQTLLEQALWQTTFAQIESTAAVTVSELVAKALQIMGEKSSWQPSQALSDGIKTIWPALLTPPGKTAAQTRADATSDQDVSPDTAPSPSAVQEERYWAKNTETEIYIDHAGLVLLHPFLPMFFEALQISKGSELLQPERALCLLHFLATGQEVVPEYDLVLPKLLCNILIENPVHTDILLSQSEKEEAAALLKAVIRHWNALRDTSPDALRGTFLCRPGKLSLRDSGDWQLQVEKKSYDILLDQLPWGIGMIQLPWMPRMLWVDWN